MELQLDWDVDKLKEGWAAGPDTDFIMSRLATVAPEVAAAGRPRRVLEVAAAEAVHSCKLNLQGIDAFVVEPSEVMLARARERMAELGAAVTLVRGVAETLPFSDRSFDRVLLDSAIDHVSDPELGIREMTRVLTPDGRLIISFVNYQSLSVRLSRRLYRLGRRLGLAPSTAILFWDSPVPQEHTFECTYDLLRRLCEPYLELDHAFGVSMAWMVPGWGAFLKRLPARRATAIMRWLDRLAYRQPRMADFVVSVWRPRARPAAGSRVVPPAAAGTNGFPDLFYASRANAESEFWTRATFGGGFYDLARPLTGDACERMTNRAYTGDPSRTWIEELIDRGPFRDAAVLGCDDAGYERFWLARGGSRRLDVYDLSPGVIRKVRAGLGLGWAETHGPRRRVRFICADLNFARLPAARYDVIWSSGCLHHIVDLEHLFAEVERALRPGGLFAIRDYVGEPRMQYADARLARINALLAEIPAQFRRAERLSPPGLSGLSPFCGIRSDAILPLAEARFELVHKGRSGGLFPLSFAVDFAAVERDAPDLFARIQTVEQEILADPTFTACGVYAVFRKR